MKAYRKDYKAIAEAIADAFSSVEHLYGDYYNVKRTLVNNLCSVFKKASVSFDKDKFKEVALKAKNKDGSGSTSNSTTV